MEPDFRRSMQWLHTWTGVVLGSILFAVFWMGTLSVFDREIDLWMKPETRLPLTSHPLSFDSVRTSLNDAIASKATFWNAVMPDDRQPYIETHYRAGKKMVSQVINPDTGQILPQTGTLGATGFFFPFHYTLELQFMHLGEWLVGLASVAMLVLCMTGVIIHRKIFAEFFTFRPQKRPGRLLLDLHNLTGVLGLPFHIILTFSGLLILGSTFFPAGIEAVYKNPRDYFYDANGLSFFPVKPGKPGVPVVSLDMAAAQASALWGKADPHMVLVVNPGQTTGRIAFFHSTEKQVTSDRDVIAFDATTGQLVSHAPLPGPALKTQRFLSGLHLIQFHHWGLRWLYFISGSGSCVLIATGFLFWMEARQKKQSASPGFRLVKGITLGSVAGIIISTLAFFIINRILPADAQYYGLTRSALEVRGFYLVWLITFLQGWLWPKRAWMLQVSAISVLALCAVLLNWLTTSDHLLHTLSHRYLWPVAGMDSMLLFTSFMAFFAARRLSRRARNEIHSKPLVAV